MTIQMTDCGPLLSEIEVQDLENEIGFKLPKEYRRFLLAHNGGRPKPRAFPIHNFPYDSFGLVQVFFGVRGEIESSTLEWNWDIHQERIPTNLFPFACDDGGDLICLSIFGEDAGS